MASSTLYSQDSTVPRALKVLFHINQSQVRTRHTAYDETIIEVDCSFFLFFSQTTKIVWKKNSRRVIFYLIAIEGQNCKNRPIH